MPLDSPDLLPDRGEREREREREREERREGERAIRRNDGFPRKIPRRWTGQSCEKLTNCARLFVPPFFNPQSTTSVLFLTVSLFDIDQAVQSDSAVTAASTTGLII